MGVILHGEIALMTDGQGRSEIQVRNNETGSMERLVFTTGTMWIPVWHLIQAIRDTHGQVDVIDGSQGACGDCVDGEYEDDEGNWKPCPVCGGVR